MNMLKKYKILKFGGSSIANADCITKVVGIIQSLKDEPTHNIVVVSALGGVTNKLSTLAGHCSDPIFLKNQLTKLYNYHQQICDTLNLNLLQFLQQSFKSLGEILENKNGLVEMELRDTVIAYGELIASQLVAGYLTQSGTPADALDARKIILTDEHFGSAFVHYQKSYYRIRTAFENLVKVQVVTGFIGATEDGRTTTLGRSGSDYTASLIGAAMNAQEIQIWTDVDGLHTADPASVHQAKSISHLNYEEAMELAHGGAEVIFPPTMIPALYKKIPIRIKNTFNPSHKGTLISNQTPESHKIAVGISSRSGVSLLRLQGAGMVGLFGLIGRIFTTLAAEKINIILVSQVFSEHSVCFVINSIHSETAESLLKHEFEFELNNHVIDKIIVENNLSLIAMVGEGMRHTPGISGKLFKTLGNQHINVIAIAQGSSERNISLIVADDSSEKTLRVLHREFFENKTDKTALILAGVGTVGSELLSISEKQKCPELCFVGVCNSRSMTLNPSGINPGKALEKLTSEGKNFDLNILLESGTDHNKKIFIDCTSSETLAFQYLEIMSRGFSIVTANKKANTQNMDTYQKLRSTALENGVGFRYETNVGAGLPVISTIKSLLSGGDKIHKIEGVLSGTLSYIFNNFDGSVPFSELVKMAHEKGFTEPDPREDLDGMDVARKCLILAREIGYDMELNDVQVESLLPEKSDQCQSVEKFIKHMEKNDAGFSQRLAKADRTNKKLCYICTVFNGKAIVKLESINEDHSFYNLKGSENTISISTDRYFNQPLVIKGHGAGAEVTAGGVLGDIMDIVREIHD